MKNPIGWADNRTSNYFIYVHVAELGKDVGRFLTSEKEQGKYPQSPFSHVNSVSGKNQYDGPKLFHRAITPIPSID
jgi:hypothetical protein